MLMKLTSGERKGERQTEGERQSQRTKGQQGR